MSRRIMLDQQMLISAVRHGLDRGLTLVSWTVREVRCVWDKLDEGPRHVIERDIRGHLESVEGLVGDDTHVVTETVTVSQWAELLAWIEAQRETALVCSKHGEPWPCPTPQASCVPVDEGDRC